MSSEKLTPDLAPEQKEDFPVKEAIMLAGAIAYFVMPADLIPDFMPCVGYSDDIAALTMAFKAAHKIFSTVAKDKAVGKAAQIFGDKFDAEGAARIVAGEIKKRRR